MGEINRQKWILWDDRCYLLTLLDQWAHKQFVLLVSSAEAREAIMQEIIPMKSLEKFPSLDPSPIISALSKEGKPTGAQLPSPPSTTWSNRLGEARWDLAGPEFQECQPPLQCRECLEDSSTFLTLLIWSPSDKEIPRTPLCSIWPETRLLWERSRSPLMRKR